MQSNSYAPGVTRTTSVALMYVYLDVLYLFKSIILVTLMLVSAY